MKIPRGISAPLVLILIAITLAAIISIELRGRLTDSDDDMVLTTQALPSAPAVPLPIALSAAEQAGPRAADILARPLFNPSRRPAAQAIANPGSLAPTLPRMTGVIVSPTGSRAIFASGGKPVVVEVGGHLGAYVVQAIEAGHVTLTGPDGKRVVAPAFDPKLPEPSTGAATGLPGLPSLTGLQGLTGIPGLGGPPPAPRVPGSPGSSR